MDDETIDFGSLLGARICHDLAGTIGGLSLVAELLADEQDPSARRDAEVAVANGVDALVAQLRFLRLAFGSGGTADGGVAAEEVRASLAALLHGDTAPVLGWVVDEAELRWDAARILLILAQIGINALPRGGRVDVGVEAGEIAVRAEGPRIALDALVVAHLSGEATERPRPRDAGAVLAAALAVRSSRRLMVAKYDGMLVLGASAPTD